MLALITKLDGANALMFHVEHCGNRKWQFQIRWPESKVPEYAAWGPVRRTAGESAIEPICDPTVPAEVRWRWDDDWCGEGPDPFADEPWEDAVPHEWGGSTAEFHVIVKQPRDFQADPLVNAVALVRHRPVVFSLVMPRRRVAVDGREILTVTGTAIGAGPSTVLRVPGEFVCSNEAYAISNAADSQVTLLPVPPKVPESLPFQGAYAVKTGRLTAEETELLLAYIATRPTPPSDSHA